MRRERYSIKPYRGKLAVVWVEDGKTKRVSTGSADQGEAQSFFEDWLAAKTTTTDPTVKELWDAYVEDKEGKAALKRMGSEWKALAPIFENLKPRQISKAHCDAHMRNRRKRGISDGTIWTELGDLATVLSWARAKKKITDTPEIKRPMKPPPKNRWLREAEVRRLINAAELPHIELAIILMLATAGRVGAILELKWDRVDFEHGIIDLAEFTGQRRKGRAAVPINATLRPYLIQAKKSAFTEYVIEWAQRPVKSIKRGFKSAVKDAGLVDVTPHTLRHTAAVHMAKRGVSMQKIAQYLGHEDDRITQRVYAKFAPEHMTDASEALDDMFSYGTPSGSHEPENENV